MKVNKFNENNNDEPKVGDYVICTENQLDHEFNNFIADNIGKIIVISNDKYAYEIRYYNIPYRFNDYFYNDIRGFGEYEIIHFSKNKAELETILATKKFNI